LPELAAFQEFQRGLADRMEAPLVREPSTRLGSYSG
jgi:hypothetical protein